MNKTIAAVFFLSVSSTMLMGCTGTEVGTATGAAAGAGIGYAVSGGDALGTAVGAGAGGLIGYQVGREQDRRRYWRHGRYYYY